MLLRVVLGPELGMGDLDDLGGVQFVFPKELTSLGGGLFGEEAGIVAGLAVEEVAEIVGFNIIQIALAHCKYYYWDDNFY
jgi:hypothetical protein